MINFTRAASTMTEHAAQACHRGASEDMTNFLAHLSGNPSVAQQVDDQNTRTIDVNRRKLRSLLECLIFCCRQNISLRDHRSETWDPATDEAPQSNPDNFLALLNFRWKCGNSSVGKDFKLPGDGPRNITYRTPRIQNELLHCLGE